MSALRFLLRLLVSLVVLTIGGRAMVAASDAGRPLSRQFLPEDYRGFEQVWDFAQTSDGLLYASNYGALREYDGREWRTIPLPTSWVFKVTAAPDGRLYTAGFDEIGYVERMADGRREYHSLIDRVPKEFLPLAQAQQCVWFRDAVWWSTANRVLRWDGRTMRVWKFDAPLRIKMHNGGKHLYVDEGTIAFYRFDEAKDDFAVLSRDPALTTLAQGVFDSWGNHGPVVVRGNGSIVAFDEQGHPTKLETESELPELSHRVIATALLSDGRLALGTIGYGLFLVTPEGKVDLRFGTYGGVASPDIHGVFEDREHGIWLGTALGLARMEPSLGVTVFDHENGAPPGVSYNVFRFRGELYSRGDNGLYKLVPGADGQFTRFVRIETPTFNANDFARHESGILIASDEGLLRYDGTTMVTEFQSHPALHFLRLSKREPDVLFYADGINLRLARWAGGKWHDEGAIEGTEMDVRSIVEDRDGSMWIGTPTRGVYRLTRKPGSTSWSDATLAGYDTARGLPEGHEWTTVRATPHGIMFVHSKGVSVYDGSGDRLVPAAAFDAIGKNGRYIYAFDAAADGTMWVQIGDPTRGDTAEIGGVTPVVGGGWRWTPLPARVSEALGYLGAQEINWDVAAGGGGALWLAGQKNLVRVDLDLIAKTDDRQTVAALLRDVTLGDGVRLPIDAAGPGALDYTREALRFHFTSPLFSSHGPLEFQFRLPGFNDSWSPWDARDEATYTNLERGAFDFQVRARVGGGEAGAITAWRFSVRPPWWQSNLAFVGYALAAGGVFFGVLRWRLGAVQRDRSRLESLVGQRTDELAQERDRAEEANQAKTMFLARMSHELRTPLHAILGYSQMLAADTTVPGAARDRLRVVRASGQHLLRLINEVLDLSKIEAGKQELKSESFDLTALLQDVCDAQEARATLKNLRFHRPTGGVSRHVMGDASKLRQVLENLLGNATKFTSHGDVELIVKPTADEARIHFSVRDTGPGIEAHEIARIFQPFIQVRDGARASEAGTGLGLAISQRLVALMGGTLEVDSTPGRGSTFHFEISLPAVAAPKEVAIVAGRLVGYEGLRRRVLAVDDVEANRALFVDLLTPLGFVVTTAVTAEEALQKIDAQRPDLLLLDLRLPGMNGFELARRIRRDPRLEGMKILAASASVLGHDPREALAAGCDGFIPKPFLEEDFLARVGELLGLAWREHAVESPIDEAPLDPAVLQDLRTAARAGDVVTMREALARLQERHVHSPHVAEFERCLQGYNLPRLIQLASQLLDHAAARDER